MNKRIFCAVLSLLLLLAAAAPGFAAETEPEPEAPGKTIRIASLRRFLTFTERCRIDSYSENLTVLLEADLDLTGTEFAGIPIFCGTFQGNGHTISGLELTADGSNQGLFRYLTDTASVYDLDVQGSVTPGGSQENVGGIAGSNAGLIRNCTFTGSVSGGENVGGIVGENALSGTLESCTMYGSLHGSHFVGGLAGKNSGVLRGCMNYAQINTTSQENTVSLSDVTLETMLGSESAATVTDIGGIAGNSTGVIRSCINRGEVGYPHMGYNIGGIAGTQSGFLVDCSNRGSVRGRKEVGGIVGQMEPAALIEYDEDALQILKKQLNGMSGTISKTAANVQSAGSALYGQVNAMQEYAGLAGDSIDLLLPDRDDPHLPDMDTIQAARNGLSASLSGMHQTLEGMGSTTASAVGTLSNNLSALQSQVSGMAATLNNVSETLGGSIEDVSDQDTEETLTGKVTDCKNYGQVLGDRNVGGITGAMALENDLDQEENWDVFGDRSLNFESQLRAVVLDCENRGVVAAGKRAAGGIVGWQSLGLVKACTNTGRVDGEDAQYVGGISGQSTGYIRSSSANCLLSGRKNLGGIAGSASIVTDCRALVSLESGYEKLGAILGGLEENLHEDVEVPVSGNYYLSVSQDPGGIDGISYDGLAQPLSQAAFFRLENLPEVFGRALVTFRFADGTEKQVRVNTGSALDPGQIPALPEQEGTIPRWEGLEEADLNHIFFDLTFEAVYEGLRSTIGSSLLSDRETENPVFLLQGAFSEDATVSVAHSQNTPELSDRETLLESWDLTLPEDPVTAGRLCLPDGCEKEHLTVRVLDSQGWRMVSHTVDGSYAVFPLDGTEVCVALTETEPIHWQMPAAIAGGVVLLGVILVLAFRKKSGKEQKK